MARKQTRKETPNERKLHKKLAEGGKLRIHRYERGKTRCVICATALVDENLRAAGVSGPANWTKKNPTLDERMDNPEGTNGTPTLNQWWLQDTESKQVIGPCGEACGGEAVINSWMKDRRDKIRQDLLAAGCPLEEIEERIWQVAHKEWRLMLKVYRKAEREATKLKLDITTMTFDEMVAAIENEKKKRAFKFQLDLAQRYGLTIVETTKKGQYGWPIFIVDNDLCETAEEVRDVVYHRRQQKQKAAQVAAKAKRALNVAQYQDHYDFIEWVRMTTQRGEPNFREIKFFDREKLTTTQHYIETGTPYPNSLQHVEQTAVHARSWPTPWVGNLGKAVKLNPKAVAAAATAGGFPVDSIGLPACDAKDYSGSVCGSALKRRQGTKHRRNGTSWNYDFWGCGRYPNCKGSLEVAEYDKRLAILQASTGVAGKYPIAAGNQTKLTKGAAAAIKKAAAKKAVPPVPPPKPVSPFKKRKERAFWGK